MQVPLVVVDPNTDVDRLVESRRRDDRHPRRAALRRSGVARRSRARSLSADAGRVARAAARLRRAGRRPRRAGRASSQRYAIVRSVAVTAPIEALAADERHRLGVLFLLDPEADLALLAEDLERRAHRDERRRLAGLLSHGVDTLARVLEHCLSQPRRDAATRASSTAWLAEYLERRITVAAWLLDHWDASPPLPPDSVVDASRCDATVARFEADPARTCATIASCARGCTGTTGRSPRRRRTDGARRRHVDWPPAFEITCPVRGGFGLFLGEVIANAVRHGVPGTVPRVTVDVRSRPAELAFRVQNLSRHAAPARSPHGEAYGGMSILRRARAAVRVARSAGSSRTGDEFLRVLARAGQRARRRRPSGLEERPPCDRLEPAAPRRSNPRNYAHAFRESASPSLRDLVDRLWWLEGPAELIGAEPIPPDGRTEIIVHGGDPFEQRDRTVAGARRSACCSPARRRAPCRCVRAASRASSGRGCGRPARTRSSAVPRTQLADRIAELDLLDRQLGADAARRRRHARERGSDGGGARSRARARRSRGRSRASPAAEPSRSRSARRGLVRVAELAPQLDLSARQIERLFRERVGLPPKVFLRIVRFQEVLGGLRWRCAADAGRAVGRDRGAHGFYDQAHFIRDFKAFVGESPGAWNIAPRAWRPSSARADGWADSSVPRGSGGSAVPRSHPARPNLPNRPEPRNPRRSELDQKPRRRHERDQPLARSRPPRATAGSTPSDWPTFRRPSAFMTSTNSVSRRRCERERPVRPQIEPRVDAAAARDCVRRRARAPSGRSSKYPTMRKVAADAELAR